MNLAAARAQLFFTSTGGLLLPVEHAPFRAEQFQRWGLRDYQEDLLSQVILLMRLGFRRILIRLPCGGGKTVMAAAMLGGASALGLMAQFIVHRKELTEQTSRTFAANGIAHGFVASGWEMSPDANVVLAGIQTLARRLHLVLPPNLVVLDECHHACAATYQRVLDSYPDDCFVIGLTATPERLDGRGLDEHFDAMVSGPGEAELIERGFLSPFDYYAPHIPDLSGVKKVAGDFDKGAVDDLMDKPSIIGNIVEHYLDLAKGKRGIVFSTSRENSKHTADAFRAEGVRAVHIDGAMDDKERDAKMAAFRAGDEEVVTNVDLFGEGVDVPDIAYVGLGRPSDSLALFIQQGLRNGRPVYADGMPRDTDEQRVAAIAAGSKPRAITCDHAGNVFRHGLPDDDRNWSLLGKAARKAAAAADGDDALPVRQCKVCFRVSPSTVKVCPGCDTEFPIQSRKIEQREGKLSKIEREELQRQNRIKRKIEERECQGFNDFLALGQARGYGDPRGWARVQIKLRSGGRI